MSQNSGGESSISSNYNSNSKPIRDELNVIYHQTAVDEVPNGQRQAEGAINPNSKELYEISDIITKAREEYLGSNFLHHEAIENGFINAVAKGLFHRELQRTEPLTKDILKRKESEIGATLFGSRPSNERIVFFNDNRQSWFFHQEITNSNGVVNSITFHYEVRQEGVVRIDNKDGVMNCKFIEGEELYNFMTATRMYKDCVLTQYGINNSSDKKAA